MGFALGCLVTAATLWRLTLSAARQAAGSAARAEAAARSAAAALTTAETGGSPSAAPAPAPAVAKPAPAKAVPAKAVPAKATTTRATTAKAKKAKATTAKRAAAKPTTTAGPARPATTARAAQQPGPKPEPASEPKADRPPTPTAAEADLPRLRPATGPVDRRGPVPRRQAGERFHFSGQCDSDEETEYEFPIEWPEGPLLAVAQIEVSTNSYLSIRPMTRTHDRIESHSSLIHLSSFDKRKGVRTVLTHDFTHLSVNSRGVGEWSVRLYSPDEVDELTGTTEGYGSTVLALRPDAPVECVAHVKSSSWYAEFFCACGQATDFFGRCGCPVPPGLPDSPTLRGGESGEALRTLLFPRAGVLKLRTDKPSDPWRLTVRPYTGKPRTR
ncbi:hypothetical protein [Kitasatospora purpeofusca]|uniref:hypothetical protein n=1 Tax=Kitasatospora purpeofusca TaxID=67352 RepID=UPI003F4AD1D2